MRKWIVGVGLIAGVVLSAPWVAAAQAIRVGQIRPQVVVPEVEARSLTVTASPTPVDITLVAGRTSSAETVAITTTWEGNCTGGCTITLYGYFSTAAAALADAGVDIPSSEILGEVTGGIPTAYTAFTNTYSGVGIAGASLELATKTVTGDETKGTSFIYDLSLEIDLANQTTLPAGTYTGTLTIEAESL